MKIFNLISQLANTTKRTVKEAILLEHQKDGDFRRAFDLAYDPYLNFWIKKIPEYTPNTATSDMSLSNGMDLLGVLSNREKTGYAGIAHLKWILESLNEYDAKVIELIIKRDLNCGVGLATINKTWPKLVKDFPLMKCHNTIEHIIYPAIAQTKSDGSRCILKCIDAATGEFVALSSSGLSIDIGDKFRNNVSRFMKTGESFDGELLCYSPLTGIPMERRTCNGIVSKAIKGTITEEEQDLFVFVAWDIIDETSTIPYRSRLQDLECRIGDKNDRITLSYWEIVNSREEAERFYLNQVEIGNEGAILKNFDSMWKPRRVKDQGKMKSELECDLIIVDTIPHTKNPNLIGAIICSVDDGSDESIKFQVGSGIRQEDNVKSPNELIGKVVTIRFNQIVRNRDMKHFQLYLPRIIEFRHDKSVGDSVETILSLKTS